MPFRAWVRSLIGLPPSSRDHKRQQRERRCRRKYQRIQDIDVIRPCIDIDIPRSSQKWSQTTENSLTTTRPGVTAPQPPPKTTPVHSPAGPLAIQKVLTSFNPPSPNRKPVEAQPCRERMSTDLVDEVIAIVSRSFDHIPYAVCGLAAMVQHGFKERLPTKVSILFPEHCRDVADHWAIVHGMRRVPGTTRSFCLSTADGKLRCLRFKFIRDDFANLVTTRKNQSHARVLALPSVADQIAEGYVRQLAGISVQMQTVFAQDMRWVLHKMSHRGEYFNHRSGANIMRREFWLPFTLSFPDMIDLFAKTDIVGDEDPCVNVAVAGSDSDELFMNVTRSYTGAGDGTSWMYDSDSSC